MRRVATTVAAISTAAGLTAAGLTGRTIQRQRRLLDQAQRSYEARITRLLDVLAKHSRVTIIRDAKGETLANRELEGPLVFLGGEQIMINACSFWAESAASDGDPVTLPAD